MGRAPVSSKFWDLIHARTQRKKQQTNFAWWSNQTWRRFLQGRLRPLPGPQFWHECWRAICLLLSILTHGHIINTRDPKPRVSRPKTRPLGLQLAGCNSNLFIIHHFFHPFCSTGCRCRQSSWMKHRSGHYSYRCPCELFALCKNKVRQKLDTRQVFVWPRILSPSHLLLLTTFVKTKTKTSKKWCVVSRSRSYLVRVVYKMTSINE